MPGDAAPSSPRPGGPLPLALAALGVVFGSIGTSPLYALAECFARKDGVTAPHALEVTHDSVHGVLSLVFWSLTMVVAVKYIAFLLRADNSGEGGILALLALVPWKKTTKASAGLVTAALFGAALLYGDGVISPAISVLSAMEGLAVAHEGFAPFVMPLSLVVLAALFLAQKRGPDAVRRFFGPVMVAWFAALGVFGLAAIAQHPSVLRALNPAWAVQLFHDSPQRAFLVLGAVVLCITGGEALYADLGPFGVGPIRLSWFGFVLPMLSLNDMGQGAWLLAHGWVEKPFWALVPEPLMYPMVLLAVAATAIASQALISGTFSLTQQAVSLGYLPRVTIVHTSEEKTEQLWIPEVNAALMVACLLLVFTFKKSSALAAAYGVAVTGAMTITSVVYFSVVTRRWSWPLWRALPLLLLFLSFDVPFFAANLVKLADGGWLPLLIALAMFVLMTTWKRGRAELATRFNASFMPLSALLEDLEATRPLRVRGTAVFMSGNPEGAPPVLLHHLKHNQALHEQVVLLSVLPADVPQVPREEQLEVTALGNGFFRVVWRTGFLEAPNVPAILKRARKHELVLQPGTTSYYLGRETLLTTGKAKMMRWRKVLFAFVSRNALPATSYFGLPPGRVVELGMQVDL